MTLECQSNCLKSNKKQQLLRTRHKEGLFNLLKSIRNETFYAVSNEKDKTLVSIIFMATETKGQFCGQVGWVTSG